MERLKKTKVLDQDNEVVTIEYEYKLLTDSANPENQRICPLITKETINGNYYTYEYDERANVKSIRKNGTLIHSYTYDQLGRLLTADNEKYDYDRNGNIKKVTSLDGSIEKHTYEYDSTYNDLLISFDNKAIVYDSGNTYNPIKIGNDKTLTYQCNLLKTFRDTTNNFYMTYDYNSAGSRIKKVRYNGSGTVLETIKYYYDENENLIYQKVESSISSVTNNKSLSFLYDELGKLYGFIYNGNSYYYVRDMLQTILGIVDSNGNSIVEYNYDAWGNIVSFVDESSCSLAKINPFKYKGYYYDDETQLYWVSSRYYSPEFGRFLQVSDVSELNPHSINGLNLYAYANNNPISYSYNNVSKKVVPTLSGSVVPNNMNVVLLPTSIGGTTNKTSTNPLSFSVGLLTPEKYDMPSWMSVYAFYAKGTLGWGYTFGDGYSLASFSAGVLDATFHTPKWFSSLPDDHWANPNIYLGFGTWNVNASIGAGISGTAEIISGTIGIQFGDAISIGVKGYVGIGFTIDFTNGIKFGVGWGLGYEISLNIDWYELFH